MQRKRIRVITSRPFATYPTVEELWADVWVQWKERPGRRRRRFGPTLMARADAAGEVTKWEWCVKHYAENPTGQSLEIPHAEMLEFAKQELPAARELLRRLDAEQFILERDPAVGTPNLYTSRPWLTRETAEELLALWLREVHGINHPKFEWDRPSIFVRSA